MLPYDSDSSSDEEQYSETNVLLGYASKEPTGDTISHLGGLPKWLDEKTPPSGTFAKCKVCNELLTLLLELHGDLPEHFPGHERRLYIFACRRKACRRKDGSIRGIRAVRISKAAESAQPHFKKEEPKPQPQLGESIFGVKPSGLASPPANPFASPSSGKAPANPFSTAGAAQNPFSTAASAPKAAEASHTIEEANSTLPETFASKARISSPKTPAPAPRPHLPWPAESSFPPPFPSYHLDADYETLDAPATPEVPNTARMDIDEGSGSGNGGKEDKEVFESTLDKTFQRFADRIGQNPEQVLRYEFRGQPLLYSKIDAVGKVLGPHSEPLSSSSKVSVSKGASGMPRCTNCGAERVFEFQLTPHAISELEADEMGIEGMEWGTIILGVCGKDCKPSDVGEGQVGYLEEWTGVQWEELTK